MPVGLPAGWVASSEPRCGGSLKAPINDFSAARADGVAAQAAAVASVCNIVSAPNRKGAMGGAPPDDPAMEDPHGDRGVLIRSEQSMDAKA
mmetsp:Transcript_95798/g.271110  ORF Transcript_95798/g.271110 Transcript_95798/m.271110 type:complete len:91 (+) Transcript_95798:108-380(+)